MGDINDFGDFQLVDEADDTDRRWRQAVAEVRAHYPEDIFPATSPSLDARSGTFARSLCDQIVRLADALRDNEERWYGTAHSDGSEGDG